MAGCLDGKKPGTEELEVTPKNVVHLVYFFIPNIQMRVKYSKGRGRPKKGGKDGEGKSKEKREHERLKG